MPCEHYKDALIDAAAVGVAVAETQSSDARMLDLRAHLESCASCREALAEEQFLFAAIDSGIHPAANAEVPTSLVPRVRARLDEFAIARPRWSSSWFALAGGAVAAAAFVLVVTTDQKNPQPAPTNLAVNRTPAPRILPSSQIGQGASPSALAKKGNSGPRPSISTPRSSAQPVELTTHKPTPEILVPRDQEILLASYANHWDSRKHPPLAAGDVDQKAGALLEISPIQITELDVKPLAEGDSQ